MNKMLKKIGCIAITAIFIGILGHLACLDPTYNSFDMSENDLKTLVINEIVARAADGGNDWIELYNAGEYTVYLRDYALVDDNTEREPVPLPDMTLEPGEFIVIPATDVAPEEGSFYVPFKLGSDDEITLYWGLTVIDVLDWKEDEVSLGFSYGRFPDGIGAASTLIPTPGTKNKAIEEILNLTLVINEIVASPVEGTDWIELYNASEDSVYLEDYALVDDNVNHAPVALPDIILESGGFIVILATDEAPEDGSFYIPYGLRIDDSVTLYMGSDIVDVLDWETGDAPSGYSYGRLPDGTENVQTLIPTPGEPNRDVESPVNNSKKILL